MARCITKHSMLKELGSKNLDLIKTKSIFAIGAGGLGTATLEYLSRLNPKEITIVDYDIVDESNLERQISYIKKDVGQKKVLSIKKRIKDFTKVSVFDRAFEDIINSRTMMKKFLNSDIIIDMTDSICSKEFVYSFCKKYKKELVFASSSGVKSYTFCTDFRDEKVNKKIESMFNKDSKKDSEEGVYSINVGLCGVLLANLVIKSLLGEQNHRNKLYNIDSWNIKLDTYNL